MRFDEVWTSLASSLPGQGSDEAAPSGQEQGLPGPAARLLTHALGPAGTGPRRVRLHLTGSVMQGGRRLTLTAKEILVPLRGFAWRATGRLGPITVTVRDHYLAGDSRVDIRLFGLVPVGGEHGPDTTASSRGRLVAESIWVPAMLRPQPGVAWEEVDDERATVAMTVDGVSESMTVRVDPQGRVREMTMHRWGGVGVDVARPLPYGFAVRAERSFGQITLPSDLDGGWWYGTERYDPARASRFVVTAVATT